MFVKAKHMMITKLASLILFPTLKVQQNRLMSRIKGRTIVITGASFGIGEALVRLLAPCQVHLVLIARTEDKLIDLAQWVRAQGSECTWIGADLYQPEEVMRVAEFLQQLPNGIDIFVSNAGKSIMRSLRDSLAREQDIIRTDQLNFRTPTSLMRAITPVLAQRKGQLINISSVNVLLPPSPKWAAYQASKVAFDQWFRSNDAEWFGLHIRTTTVYLPLVRTRMIAPNPIYQHVPAMSPEQAAIRIAHLMGKNTGFWQPWWSFVPQFLGVLLGRRGWRMMTRWLVGKLGVL